MIEEYVIKDGLKYCPKCNKPLEKRFPDTIFGKEFKVHIMCDCEREAYETEQRERADRERQEELERNRSICFHEKKMLDWIFANDDGSTPHLDKAKAFVDNLPEIRNRGAGLLLWGGVGTGKTYMAGCIANALLDQGKKVLMTDFVSITNISAFSIQKYTASLSVYDLLIIDDLGAERRTEFALQNVFDVVNRRWESGKPLIVTTNLDLDVLKNAEDITMKRIYDRVLAMCTPVFINGPSKRKDIAEDKRLFYKSIFSKKGDEVDE